MKRFRFPFFVIAMAFICGLLMWLLALAQDSLQSSSHSTMIPILLPITLTAYSPSRSQTDSNPFETASGQILSTADLEHQLYAAASRDLLAKFTPGAPLKYGDKIYLEFTVIDTMHERWTDRIDLFTREQKIAQYIGIQPNRNIIILKEQK